MVDINICVSSDNNYVQHAGVVIASILANAAAEDSLNFFILDGGISDENKSKILQLKKLKDCHIEFIAIDASLFSGYQAIKTHGYITLPTYYRLKTASLLPKLDRIIYMDCDMIATRSLANLFNTEMDDFPLAGVNDINSRRVRKNPTYINAGMTVMNLKKIREMELEDKFQTYAANNAETITCGDQQIINEVCKGKIKILDERWNVQSSNFVNRSSYTSAPWIIHFVSSKKPWHKNCLSIHKHLYFKHLQLTPWALDEDTLQSWTGGSKWASRWAYMKYRPFFWLRPKFYKSLYWTFVGKK